MSRSFEPVYGVYAVGVLLKVRTKLLWHLIDLPYSGGKTSYMGVKVE